MKVGKIVVVMIVILVALWLVWSTLVWVRGRQVSVSKGNLESNVSKQRSEQHVELVREEKVQGGAPNGYLKTGDEKNNHQFVQYTGPLSCGNWVDGYTYMNDNNTDSFDIIIGNNIININDPFAFQNELYAIKVANKWLFKYGVVAKRLYTMQKGNKKWEERPLFAEYDMHGINKIITNLNDKAIRINNTLANASTNAALHYTHCYVLKTDEQGNQIPREGKKIGAWLHVMEMAGHRALVWYLNQTYGPVLSISDEHFETNADAAIKQMLRENNIEFRNKCQNVFRKGKKSATLIKDFIKEMKENKLGADTNKNNLYAYLVANGATKGFSNGSNITIKFTIESSMESEFFCPMQQTDEGWSPIIITDDIQVVLEKINTRILNYQKFICENIPSGDNPCPIQQINVFNNDTLIDPPPIHTDIGPHNENGDISNYNNNTNTVIDRIKPPIHNIIYSNDPQFNIGDMWTKIIKHRYTRKEEGVYINHNGAFDLICKQYNTHNIPNTIPL